jgi:Zn-dependent protease
MNFRNPTRDMVISSLAGPASNFATAIAAAAIVRLVVVLHLGGFVVMLAYSFVMVNLFFGVFNLLPIPPLDGWRLLHYFMPPSSAYAVEVFVARYGILVMFGLMLIAPFLARLVAPVATVIGHLLIGA